MGRRLDRGLRRSVLGERRRDRPVQDSGPHRRTTASTSTASAGTGARAPGCRHDHAVGDAAADASPTRCRHRDRARRLRQLGGVGVVDRAGDRHVRACTSPTSCRSTARPSGTAACSSSARTATRATSSCRPPTRRTRRTTSGAATASTRAGLLRPRRRRSATTAQSTPAELENDFFYAEYPLVRWLERNGYDVSYTSCIDTDRRPAELRKHKVFVSSGHDEYWSGGDAGQCRSGTRRRRQPCLHDRQRGVLEDALGGRRSTERTRRTGPWSVTRRRSTTPRSTPARSGPARGAIRGSARPADGGLPRTRSPAHCSGRSTRSTTPTSRSRFRPQYAQLRFWRNTAVATLAPGQVATLSPATLGYEWDTDADNGPRPAGLVRLSETTRGRGPGAAGLRRHVHRGPADALHDDVPGARAARSCGAPAPCSGRGASTSYHRNRPRHAGADRREHAAG